MRRPFRFALKADYSIGKLLVKLLHLLYEGWRHLAATISPPLKPGCTSAAAHEHQSMPEIVQNLQIVPS